ncbi:hypothetical protein F5148DRAFT_1151929 [Russula earlei]|uniref:Uncharacterized protein n=1 Tax=Russula earlei TaxID=71964 RepID=A0ACC0TZC2_9AGAM|nr:hypothetical protein F5148DRAFT_1151929 [Russula earlei]
MNSLLWRRNGSKLSSQDKERGDKVDSQEEGQGEKVDHDVVEEQALVVWQLRYWQVFYAVQGCPKCDWHAQLGEQQLVIVEEMWEEWWKLEGSVQKVRDSLYKETGLFSRGRGWWLEAEEGFPQHQQASTCSQMSQFCIAWSPARLTGHVPSTQVPRPACCSAAEHSLAS